MHPNSAHARPARRRLLGATVGLTLLLAACGDDEESPEDAFCDAADTLEQNVTALGEMDVAAEGTDALGDALAQIESDVAALLDAGSEVAEAELAALDDALNTLEASVEEVSDSAGADEVTALVSGVGTALAAADAVIVKLDETCE
jgi:hypothetical protein